MTTNRGDMRGRLTTAELARDFTLGGNSYFTLRSTRTTTRYTYNVRLQKEMQPPQWRVSLLVGPDRYSQIGWIRQGEFVKLLKEGKNPGAHSFGWFWWKMVQGEMPEALEVWHDGQCGVCGRQLTVPESVARGIGPECAMRLKAMDMLDELMEDES